MARVICGVCKNFLGGIAHVCARKNKGIQPNKRRNCKLYVFDETKVKDTVQIKTIKMGFTAQKEARIKAKQQRKEAIAYIKNQMKMAGVTSEMSEQEKIERLRAAASIQNNQPQMPGVLSNDPTSKYPMSGDLSRFVSSAAVSNKETSEPVEENIIETEEI